MTAEMVVLTEREVWKELLSASMILPLQPKFFKH